MQVSAVTSQLVEAMMALTQVRSQLQEQLSKLALLVHGEIQLWSVPPFFVSS